MTWTKFQEAFIGKYFPETARHAKAQEFLELKQGATTVMDYVARFTELAQFADDYVTTYMTKVRRFVTPPTRHPKWASSEGVTLRDCDWDSLNFSFSELTPAFICTISVITKISFYIYIIHTTIVAFIIFYTHILESLFLYFYKIQYYKTIHIKSEIAEQCGEHLSLRWPALLM